MTDRVEEIARAIWRHTYRHLTLIEWHEVKAGSLHHKRTLEAAKAIASLSPARDAVLEEAAKVAEWAHMVLPDGGSPSEDERRVAEAAAAAIRALKGHRQHQK